MHKGNHGVDPKPEHGNDQKGHKDNGKGNGGGHHTPSRPSKPGHSHPSVAVWNNQLFND